jgi:hypothetical protein
MPRGRKSTKFVKQILLTYTIRNLSIFGLPQNFLHENDKVGRVTVFA